MRFPFCTLQFSFCIFFSLPSLYTRTSHYAIPSPKSSTLSGNNFLNLSSLSLIPRTSLPNGVATYSVCFSPTIASRSNLTTSRRSVSSPSDSAARAFSMSTICAISTFRYDADESLSSISVRFFLLSVTKSRMSMKRY